MEDENLIYYLIAKGRVPKVAGPVSDLRVIGDVIYFDYPDFWVTTDELDHLPGARAYLKSVLKKPNFKVKKSENNTLILEEFTCNVSTTNFQELVKRCWFCGNSPDYYLNPPPWPP